MAARNLFALFFIALTLNSIACLPEQGVWTKIMNEENDFFAISKSLYNNSRVSVNIECQSKVKLTLKIGWVFRMTPCGAEYIGSDEPTRAKVYFYRPDIDQDKLGYKEVKYQQSSGECASGSPHDPHACMLKYECEAGKAIILKDETTKNPDVRKTMAILSEQNKAQNHSVSANSTHMEATGTASPQTKKDAKKKTPSTKSSSTAKPTKKPKSRRKRAAVENKIKVKSTTTTPKNLAKTSPKTPVNKTTTKPHLDPSKPHDTSDVVKTWQDGVYLFVLHMEQPDEMDFSAKVTVWMRADYGYLSAGDWPLLPFYGVMCAIYVIYGVIWLVLSACNWRDLLRIQFWIGGVIILGMLEKAVFYAEYQTINSTGQSVRGAVVFAEVVSCGKRTLARMLVVIVSLGFGIVKPRLGPMLHRVIGMGALYFILGSVEGCLRVLRPKSDPSNQALLANIPLAVLDAAICWWVFTSLVQTTRTLRLRRNVVKLSLYRHFTNTLIFAILASIAFMIWSIKEHKLANCLRDWKEIWVDDAYWHLLFSVILMVIMVLWRPTNNNQRYAFSPLLDAADEEDGEPMLNDAFDGMKLRGMKGQANGSPKPREGKPKDAKAKVEDDLKWIEDNIPSSVADTALPSLLDSDEEIMTTKFEMSKME